MDKSKHTITIPREEYDQLVINQEHFEADRDTFEKTLEGFQEEFLNNCKGFVVCEDRHSHHFATAYVPFHKRYKFINGTDEFKQHFYELILDKDDYQKYKANSNKFESALKKVKTYASKGNTLGSRRTSLNQIDIIVSEVFEKWPVE